MLMLRGRATRWLADDFPGWVEVAVTDVDGVVHRFTEKAAVIDADDRLHARAQYPVDIEVACRPHTRHVRRDEAINVVDLSPWGGGEVGSRYAVTRDLLSWRAPGVHSDLSVRARQATALVTFRRWREEVGLDAVDLASLEDHLWEWMTVGPETFRAWYESHPLAAMGEGEQLPRTVRDAVAGRGIGQDSIRDAVHALVAITYGGLFGGIESDWSLGELETVGRFTARHGVPLASADEFVDSLWIDDDWGRPDDALVARWRESR
ncbi:hypothetical protein [Cellulomonas terrae]|uniref:hypothetical protein n=1 Tax=Cellulomonas terrae TaxID=311234 RepID=UPI0011BDF8DC|nr:hypothetical protein [Cellulomonas terrae]